MSEPKGRYIRGYIRGGQGSHWQGCEETHRDCRIAGLEAENAALLLRLEEATARAEAAMMAVEQMRRARDRAIDRLMDMLDNCV